MPAGAGVLGGGIGGGTRGGGGGALRARPAAKPGARAAGGVGGSSLPPARPGPALGASCWRACAPRWPPCACAPRCATPSCTCAWWGWHSVMMRRRSMSGEVRSIGCERAGQQSQAGRAARAWVGAGRSSAGDGSPSPAARRAGLCAPSTRACTQGGEGGGLLAPGGGGQTGWWGREASSSCLRRPQLDPACPAALASAAAAPSPSHPTPAGRPPPAPLPPPPPLAGRLVGCWVAECSGEMVKVRSWRRTPPLAGIHAGGIGGCRVPWGCQHGRTGGGARWRLGCPSCVHTP